MTIPYTPEELEAGRGAHRLWEGSEPALCEHCKTLWPCVPARLLATVEDRDQEIARLRNGLTEVIDCSSGSNPEEIMAGIARETLCPGSHLMPVGARTAGNELVSWKCARCGEWIRE